jgi:hypothetical protein
MYSIWGFGYSYLSPAKKSGDFVMSDRIILCASPTGSRQENKVVLQPLV